MLKIKLIGLAIGLTTLLGGCVYNPYNGVYEPAVVAGPVVAAPVVVAPGYYGGGYGYRGGYGGYRGYGGGYRRW